MPLSQQQISLLDAQASAGRPLINGDPVGWALWPWQLKTQPALKQSVFVFGGQTMGSNLGSAFVWNLDKPNQKTWDNYIIGGAYQRDLIQFNGGALMGLEIGLADRFGHYRSCCDTVIYSNSILQSAELWIAATVRYEFNFFDTVRIAPGFVFGFSAITDPIGQESEHQVVHQGSAKVLFYLGFEGAFSLAQLPDTELVVRVHHRSGAYGTLGGLKEGNNADVIGMRQRF